MVTKHDLPEWVFDALTRLNGKGTIAQICKDIWVNHEAELRASGDLFYTWQYDMRWASQLLRDQGKLRKYGRSGTWELV